MITANELRIGNYILDDEGIIIRVNQIAEPDNKQLTECINGFNQNMLAACNGIPLTEEWLVKFGFTYWDGRNYYYNDLLGFYFYKKGKRRLSMTNLVFDAHVNKRLDYVHQLQNLYFALTGGELIIVNK